ncbi:MAG TPA: hypothetical protein VKG23_05145, partial [Thermoanaerobaculia bacterium]|nr:hypothetical protein [Thermoanaerobaculia bacterium]
DVVAEFDAWTAKNLGGINDQLKAKSLTPIEPLTRESWEKQAEQESEGSGGASSSAREGFPERD